MFIKARRRTAFNNVRRSSSDDYACNTYKVLCKIDKFSKI